MRYAPGHNDATRERSLEAAARLFREHGIAAVGLAKIMAEADLTVGTFYTHFKPKEVLLREALHRVLQERHTMLDAAHHGDDLEVTVRAYLSPEHRDAQSKVGSWPIWPDFDPDASRCYPAGAVTSTRMTGAPAFARLQVENMN